MPTLYRETPGAGTYECSVPAGCGMPRGIINLAKFGVAQSAPCDSVGRKGMEGCLCC